MSDENSNEATPAEPLVGREAIEVAAGFIPYKAETAEEAPPLTIADAVEQRANARAAESDIVTYSSIKDLPENVTLTPEDAAKLRAEERAEKEKAAEEKQQAKVREEVDQLRGVSPDEADAIDAVDGLEPETRKALKIPQVRQAIEMEFDEANKVRETYSTALSHAQQFAQATFFEAVPELSGLPLEQIEQGLAMLQQVDPARFNVAMSTLNRVATIQQAQQQEHQQRAYLQRQQFDAIRKQYSRASDAALGPMTAAEKTAIVNDLVSYVGDYGITREQFVREAETNLTLHHPAFQKMAADAVRYQRMTKAAKALPTRQVPPVQRPGTSNSTPRSSSSSSKIAELEKKFTSATGDRAVRIRAQIHGLQRAARG